MLHLVCEGSRGEPVHNRFSTRMKGRFDIFGRLRDALGDGLIEDEERLEHGPK